MREIISTSSGVYINSEGKFLTSETATDVVALLECSDYYLAHPSTQPKTDIGEYVESLGFRVPKRYKNLQEALESGKDFIMRSEHPQDYDGVSGLFESKKYHTKDGITEILDPTQDEVLRDQKEILELERVKEFCRETGKNYEEFFSQASFEYQEYIEGENLTVVRDEAVEGRYHIFVNDNSRSDYICYDSGNIIQGNIPKNIGIENIEKLINQYEKISKLPRFDDLQCPNIEFQIGDDGNIYFLQYKRGHQKQLHKWNLERELKEGEIEAQFVRGATKQGGEEFELKKYGIYPYLIPKEQDILNDYDLLFNIKLPICIDVQSGNGKVLGFHGCVSEVSQTGIYLKLSHESFDNLPTVKIWYKLRILEGIKNYLHKRDDNIFRDLTLKVRIYSDGKKAIVKFLTSIEDLIQMGLDAGYSREEMDRDINESIEKARDK